MKSKITHIPKSATSFGINLISLFAYLVGFSILKDLAIPPFSTALIGIAIIAVTVIILEKIVLGKQHRQSSGVSFLNKNRVNFKRVAIKLLGLYTTLLLAGFFYWLIPEYNNDYFYTRYFQLAESLLYIICLGAIPYFILMDRIMSKPEDSYWHVGLLVLGKKQQTDSKILKHHGLGWLVKVFFLAIMVPYFIDNTNYLLENSIPNPQINFGGFYDYMYNLSYTIDLAYVCTGYILTLKILDSDIRTAEPTFLGWFVAILCYKPLWDSFANAIFKYEEGYYWGHWLEGNAIYKIWGSAILFFLAIYVLATVVFGIRFSNLTNRGIITNGPYRLMKHPAYISKNISWWLISVPFISQESVEVAIKHCFLLLGVNFIYYMRAKTEERHLSLDPTYVTYATAMNEKSIFRGLYRRFPRLKYDVNKYIKDGEIRTIGF